MPIRWVTEHSRKARRLVECCFVAILADARRKQEKAIEWARQYQRPLLGLAWLAFVLALKRWAYVDMHIAGAHHCKEYGWDDFVGRRVVWDAVPINSELDILKAGPRYRRRPTLAAVAHGSAGSAART